MKITSCWSHFEERVASALADSTTNATGTKTLTAAREEDDQDVATADFAAIPGSTLLATMTITQAREEMDQDPPGTNYGAILVHSHTGTETVTKAEREEADQDAACRGYQTLPLDESS